MDFFEISSAELHEKTIQFIANLQSLNPKSKTLISLLGNSIQWNIVDHACLLSGWVHIPLNENLSVNEIKSIIKDVQPNVIVYKKKRHLKLISKLVDLCNTDVINISAEFNSIHQNIKLPKLNLDKTALILYTSGSTSIMKGVIHSHNSLINAIKVFSPIIKSLNVTRALSYLPLSFSGERKLNYTYQNLGIDICYASTAKGLLDNILLFKPDIMALVPSLLERLIDVLENQNKSCSLKYIVCGGAPIHPNIKLRYSNLSIQVIELYGLTETASIGTANISTNPSKINSVGQPLLGVDFHFLDNNEICIHCDSLMTDYLTQPANWLKINGKKYLKTGDIGHLDEDNYLYITGRVNDIIKLQNGTWFLPQTSESQLIKISNNQFSNVFITILSSKLTAIIITDLEVEIVQKIIDKFNNNGFIYIDEIIVYKNSVFKEQFSDFKISRKKIFQQIFKS